MRLTARQLNRATLARQMLLRREPMPVAKAVRRILAVQAQSPASPYVALWNRIADFDPSDLDGAFARHAVVKATLMRVTLHAVAAADYPALHEAMQTTLRAARLNDRRFTSEHVSLDEVNALLPDLLAYTAAPRTNADLEAWMEARFGTAKPRVWWALRHYGPFVHAATGGAWSFGPRPVYIAAPEQRRPGDAEELRRTLVRRYLEAFGPATVPDIAQFGLLNRPLIRQAVAELDDALVEVEGPDGKPLLDVPGGLLPPEDSPAPPRLMAMWDSTLMAYAERGRMIPSDYRKAVTRTNGDVLPTLLVDGHVAGVWRPVEGGIEATAFRRFTHDEWDGLETEARSLIALLAEREARPYGRYGRWWADLPAVNVRILGRQ